MSILSDDMLDEIVAGLVVAGIIGVATAAFRLFGSRERRRREYRDSLELLALENQISAQQLDAAAQARYDALRGQYGDLSPSAIGHGGHPGFDKSDFFIAALPSLALAGILIWGYLDAQTSQNTLMEGAISVGLIGLVGAWLIEKLVNRITRWMVAGWIMSFVFGAIWMLIALAISAVLFGQ